MKTLNYGIEVECIGASRQALAAAIQRVVGGTVFGTSYHATVRAPDGREWNVVNDGSLSGSVNGEIVSPILTYSDLEALQNIVREVRKAGATVDESCSIHVHVGVERFDAPAIGRLIKLMNKNELIIEKALGISSARLGRYCKRVDQAMLRRLELERPTTMAQLKRVWYGEENVTAQRYHHSRYAGLNVNSTFVRSTVEFRVFQGSLHAGEVKAYVQLSLGLAAKALTSKSASSKKREFKPASGRYDMRTLLLALNFVGDEFRTARLHLTKRLGGSSAWKNGRPAPATTQVAPLA